MTTHNRTQKELVMKKVINKDPLYFVDYGVHYDGDHEYYQKKFSTMNVRKLNITQDELTHILNQMIKNLMN